MPDNNNQADSLYLKHVEYHVWSIFQEKTRFKYVLSIFSTVLTKKATVYSL